MGHPGGSAASTAAAGGAAPPDQNLVPESQHLASDYAAAFAHAVEATIDGVAEAIQVCDAGLALHLLHKGPSRDLCATMVLGEIELSILGISCRVQ
jgi:hypothetical protein